MKLSKKGIEDVILIILMVFLAIANACPYIFLTGMERPFYFICLFCCIIAIAMKKGMSTIVSRSYFFRIALITLMTLISLVLGNIVYMNRYLHLSGLLIYIIMYENIEDKKIFKYSTYIITVIASVTCVQSLLVLRYQPYAARTADYKANWQLLGVGGYQFIYAIALGSVLLFAFIINNKFTYKSMIGFAIWGLFIVTIYKSNFMIAVIISAFGAILCIIMHRDRAKIKIVQILVVIIVLPLLSGVISAFLNNVIQHIMPESGRIANIFSGSTTSFWGTIVNEFKIDRLPTLQASITAVKEHPLLGLIISNSNIDSFGQHSTLLDTLALWGIPIGLAYIYLMLEPFFTKNRFKNYAYTIPLMISFILLALFNNIECTSAYVMFIIGIYIIDREGTNSESKGRDGWMKP